MLSVPTLGTVFVVNFMALGLVWTYVMRSYPNFSAARFWTGSCYLAALGAAVSMLRNFIDSLIPLLAGGTVLIAACCVAGMGVSRFYGQPVAWRASVLTTVLSFAGITFFLVVQDDMAMRVLVYSLGLSIPIALTLKLVLSRRGGPDHPGARLAGIVAILILA